MTNVAHLSHMGDNVAQITIANGSQERGHGTEKGPANFFPKGPDR